MTRMSCCAFHPDSFFETCPVERVMAVRHARSAFTEQFPQTGSHHEETEFFEKLRERGFEVKRIDD